MKIRRSIGPLALAAASLGAGCGRSQGGASYRMSAPENEARVFAEGVISKGVVFGLALSPDGTEAHFTRADPATKTAHVMLSRFRDERWQEAEPAAFSGEGFSDLDPALSPDGRRLFFISTRPREDTPPGARADMDIWYVDREGAGWGAPRHPQGPNGPGKEGSPSVGRDGTLYFFSDRGTPGANAIYRARPVGGDYGPAERLGPEVNAGPSDTSPFVAPDGRALWFYSTRPGGAGAADLYVSCARGDGWTPAQSLGPAVNTPAFESNPYVSPDGRYLFFGREGKFYQIAVSVLPRACPA